MINDSSPNIRIDGIAVDPCDKWKESEKILSDAYLRIRALLEAWDTTHGGANRFEVTEQCIRDLIAERDDYKGRLQSIIDIAKIRS